MHFESKTSRNRFSFVLNTYKGDETEKKSHWLISFVSQQKQLQILPAV